MAAKFSGGKNIAMKVPPHQYEATVAFYRDVDLFPYRAIEAGLRILIQ